MNQHNNGKLLGDLTDAEFNELSEDNHRRYLANLDEKLHGELLNERMVLNEEKFFRINNADRPGRAAAPRSGITCWQRTHYFSGFDIICDAGDCVLPADRILYGYYKPFRESR